MIVNVSDLLEKRVLKKDIEYTFGNKDLTSEIEDIEFLKPISVKGVLKNIDDIVTFQGTIDSQIELTCSRCLEKFKYDVNIKVCERFSNNDMGDADVIYIDNSNIDLNQIIINNIIMAFPLKPLCKPNCKGLCQVCGTNLNYNECNCKQNNNIDFRLVKLKDFFSSK